jgi:hypothetical protein
MSTKAIEQCLLAMKEDTPLSPDGEAMVDAALAEVRAIRAAAKTLCRMRLYVPEGSPAADHKALCEAADLIRDISMERGEGAVP